MAPGGTTSLKTRTRDDGTVMVETAPHRWVSAPWLKQQGGEAKAIDKSSAPEQTDRQSAEQGIGHNCLPLGAGSHRPAPKPSSSKTSPQPASLTSGTGRRSGTPGLRNGEVGRAGRAGEGGASDGRQPLPLPLSPAQKLEIAVNLYATTALTYRAIAKMAGTAVGVLSQWVGVCRRNGDARVIAGDKRRGRE